MILLGQLDAEKIGEAVLVYVWKTIIIHPPPLSIQDFFLFLAALSSSRSQVVGQSVRWSVGRSDTFVKNGPE